MQIRSRRTVVVGACTLTALTAAAGGWLLVSDERDSEHAPSVAIVNEDKGTAGAAIVKNLQADTDFTWAETSSEDAASHDASITLPPDLSQSVASLSTPNPQRATVAVTGPEGTANRLSDLVTDQVRALGIDGALGSVNSARSTLSMLTLNTQLLGAGVNAAKDGANQFSSGVTELTGYLDTARDGSGQLAAAIGQLDSVVTGATDQAGRLASSLSATGLTVGQVTDNAKRVSTGLDDALGLLRSSPIPLSPDQTKAVGELEGVRDAAQQVNTQLNGLSGVLGAPVDPNTDLGKLLTNVVGQLTGASGQLTDGANQLAGGLAQLSSEGAAQLSSATGQLTGGVDQLDHISHSLTDQVNKGLAAVPARSAAQQKSLTSTLSDPITLQRNTVANGPRIELPELLAIAFGITTLVLAIACARMVVVAHRRN